MASIEELKAKTQAAIDARRGWLIDIAKTILNHPAEMPPVPPRWL